MTARIRAADPLALVRAITSFGPALLGAIAARRGPYSALRAYASPKQINRSLDQLAYNGLTYQPKPRTWLLSEPMLSDAYAEWSTAD
jgi:hypothetical protein